MAKKVTGFLKLQVPAGAANPSPPIGPALGQRGLAIMDFCKQFNAATAKMEKGMPIPVVITTYADRSFSFELKTPPVSYFIKKAAKLESGSKTPGRDKAGAITRMQVKEIAEQKMKDLNCDTIDSAMKMVAGSARSMGIVGHGVIAMTNLGKRTNKAREGIDREKLYSIDEAVR
jgi:large subunit ribosomal protein L11